MTSEPCHEMRTEVEAALKEWERVRTEQSPKPGLSAPSNQATPQMGGDLGTRFYEAVSRKEAASRRYRSAVRALAECLRQHKSRPGIIGSAHG